MPNDNPNQNSGTRLCNADVQLQKNGGMKINVLSLFNGMNTGRQALENVGVDVGNYYSSEIKKSAITVTQHHFPDTIQIGDINNWREWDIDWHTIDLILSGSPCQDLSIAGKRKGLKGERSGLFFVFIEIRNHINTERKKKGKSEALFFQENVGSAPKLDVGIMSRALGVYLVRINSNLVTAQLRDRYYWSNIRTKPRGLFGELVTDIPQPKDQGIMFKDILTDGFTDREKSQTLLQSEAKTYGYTDTEKFSIFIKKRLDEGKQVCNYVIRDKALSILESESRVEKGESLHKRNLKSLRNAVYLSKYPELLELEGDRLKVKTNTIDGFDYATTEDCLNLAFPKSETRRARITKGKAPCLLEGDEPLFAFTGSDIRPLNKIELCRLQGFPDDYCDVLSRNQAASVLGDGWTLPIVEHFFQYLPSEWRKQQNAELT